MYICNYEMFQIFINWVAENKANLVWTAGFALGSENKKIDKFLTNLRQKNNFDQLFLKMEEMLSKYGAIVAFFDKNNQIRLSNPIFPILIASDGEKIIRMQFAETSKGLVSQPYFKMVEINENGTYFSQSFTTTVWSISKNQFDLKKNKLSWFENASKAPNDMPNKNAEINKLQEFQVNKFKILNGVYMLNIEKFNPLLVNLNFRTPDWRNLNRSIFGDLSESYEAIINDILTSRNKLVLYDDKLKQEILNNQDVSDKLKSATKSMIYRSMRGPVVGGKEIGTEFIKATPNSAILWKGFHDLFDYALNLCGYSSFRQESAYSTATANRYSRDLDLTLIETKRKIRTNQINQLLDAILIANGFWDGNGKRPYYFSIFDTPTTDPEAGLNRTKQLEDFGYITKTEAIMRIFKNFTKEEAEAKIKEIVAEREKYPELFNQNENNSYKSQEQSLIKPDKNVQNKQMESNQKMVVK